MKKLHVLLVLILGFSLWAQDTEEQSDDELHLYGVLEFSTEESLPWMVGRFGSSGYLDALSFALYPQAAGGVAIELARKARVHLVFEQLLGIFPVLTVEALIYRKAPAIGSTTRAILRVRMSERTSFDTIVGFNAMLMNRYEDVRLVPRAEFGVRFNLGTFYILNTFESGLDDTVVISPHPTTIKFGFGFNLD